MPFFFCTFVQAAETTRLCLCVVAVGDEWSVTNSRQGWKKKMNVAFLCKNLFFLFFLFSPFILFPVFFFLLFLYFGNRTLLEDPVFSFFSNFSANLDNDDVLNSVGLLSKQLLQRVLCVFRLC